MMQLLKSLRYKLALIAALLPHSMFAQTVAADPLSGVWGAEVRFGIPVQGELTLDGREGMWRASIGGFQVAVEQNGSEIQFKLPDDIAEFRGIRDPASDSVRGEWIQQGGLILDPQYASPVELHRIAPLVWRGTVVALEQRISVYLFISTKDGKTTATAAIRRAIFSADEYTA
jgi:hypothetical protein